MATALTIVGSPMRADLQLNDIPRALAQESEDLTVFEWRPIPGRIMGASFDWVAVVGTTADLLAIAGAIWAVYQKVIKPRRKSSSETEPGFLLQARNNHETFVQIVIQPNTTEEVFIEEFTRTVSALRVSASTTTEEAIIEQYEHAESYRRVHVRRDA